MFDNISDKKLNRYIVVGFIIIIVLFTVIRLTPFITADANKKATQFIGAPLPPSAKNIKYADKADFHGGDYFVAVTISQPEFREITTNLQMSYRRDLLTDWPTALESTVPWWNPSPVNDTNTVYANRPLEFSRVVARYENGTMYFKRNVPKR